MKQQPYPDGHPEHSVAPKHLFQSTLDSGAQPNMFNWVTLAHFMYYDLSPLKCILAFSPKEVDVVLEDKLEYIILIDAITRVRLPN